MRVYIVYICIFVSWLCWDCNLFLALMLERATKVLLDVISEVYCYFYVPLSGEWSAIKRQRDRERERERRESERDRVPLVNLLSLAFD